MIKYHYSYTDHRIVISGEKPEDMRVSAKANILYLEESCYVENQAGGSNQPRKTHYFKSKESEDGKHYQIEVPTDVETGICSPSFSSITVYGQNKIYDINLLSFGTINSAKREVISLKTDDKFVATCGRELVSDVAENVKPFLISMRCSLDLNDKNIVAKADDTNRYNYIPIEKPYLNSTTSFTLNINKDQYYQSERDNPPKVPEGVRYSNSYKYEGRLED